MAAHVIDGRRLARELKEGLATEIKLLAEQGIRPGLATVLAGESYPANVWLVRNAVAAARLTAEVDAAVSHLRCPPQVFDPSK